MKLIGVLSWWMEPPEDLEQAIRGYHACGIRHLLAVDGAYGPFPGATASSTDLEHQTLDRVCTELGIDWWCYVPPSPWATETDKRAFAFACAEGTFDATVRDWYVVIDADERVINPTDLRPLLATLDENAADLHMIEPAGGDNPYRAFDIRKAFRALPGLTVRDNHHHYVTGDGRVLWGFGQEESADLTSLRVEHRTNLRDEDRVERKRAYYLARDATGIEKQTGCWDCGTATDQAMRSGFTYADGKVRSSYYRTCPQHIAALQVRNREQILQRVLPHLLCEAIEIAPRPWRRLSVRNPKKAAVELAAVVAMSMREHGLDKATGLYGRQLLQYILSSDAPTGEVTRAA